MANSMGDERSFIREESDNNIFNSRDNPAVTNSDIETNDINKLKTEVVGLKMFVSEQLYIIKLSVGSPKTSVCNCSSKNNIYIDSLLDQINYLREENKIKNSIIQSLLCHSSSQNVDDKRDNSSPISEMAENSNLNNNLDNRLHIAADDNFAETKENLFDKTVDDNFVDTKENDHEKDEDSGKPLEHKYVKTRKKRKRKRKIIMNN